jgi:hypothetical protein
MQALQERPVENADLLTFLHATHDELDRLFDRLLEAVQADDQREIHAQWVSIEGHLLAHMEAEERFVLPMFARLELGEAKALLAEHARLRDLILELGIAVELHYLRLDPCKQLIATLQTHEQREEALLYRWAATRLDDRLVAAARRHIAAARDLANR